MRPLVPYLPVLTTLVACAFAVVVHGRWRERGGRHLLWWSIGLTTYAAGAGAEAATTVFGWHQAVFRVWYVTGALLGGAPLAQGTAYLLLSRRVANRLAIALVAVVGIGALAVAFTPIDDQLVQPYRLTGRVMIWQWARFISPIVNLYALVLLVGGAVVSAARYARRPQTRHRCVANVLIAVGGLLPGIGGAFTRFGHTDVLYVTELLGLLLIFGGYRASVAVSTARQAAGTSPVLA